MEKIFNPYRNRPTTRDLGYDLCQGRQDRASAKILGELIEETRKSTSLGWDRKPSTWAWVKGSRIVQRLSWAYQQGDLAWTASGHELSGFVLDRRSAIRRASKKKSGLPPLNPSCWLQRNSRESWRAHAFRLECSRSNRFVSIQSARSQLPCTEDFRVQQHGPKTDRRIHGGTSR